MKQTDVEHHDLRQRLVQKIAAYSHLSELFKDRIPSSPPLTASIYKGVDVGKIWGERFTFWNILLHDDHPEWNSLLREIDEFVARYDADYGDERLRKGGLLKVHRCEDTILGQTTEDTFLNCS